MKTLDAIKVLSALAQESRLAIFRLLVEQGPDGLPVGEIGECLGLANATLSFHLKELLHAGLVTSRQAGRFIYYAPVISSVNELVEYLTENCCAASGVQCGPPPVVTRAKSERAAAARSARAKASGR
ncbi:ArsR/SmtB family transcription factor [Luteibacter sp. CQ10]|uniref:ArsR/SmtB family transcription factor n=1 Tax=Luteibacter sp. CQ10 TaxID=2805821 RepID=UPI0034A5B1F5